MKIILIFAAFLLTALSLSRTVDRLYLWNYYRKNASYAKDLQFRQSLRNEGTWKLHTGIFWLVVTCVFGYGFYYIIGM